MSFRFIVFQNDKAIAGFNNYNSACTYKELIQNINRTAGYRDRFQITDTKNHN